MSGEDSAKSTPWRSLLVFFRALVTPDESRFFTIVDVYARTRHRCFLTEMSPGTKDTGYSLCFRPLGLTMDSPNRYACKYIRVTIEQVRVVGEGNTLSVSLTGKLDSELAALSRLAG